jgi:fatty-acyl-CoA synthase
MLPSGHLRIVGRLKDVVIRGGENIYPREIEDFLHTHENIQEAQVLGVPDPRMGEEVAAWISIVDGKSLTEQELRDYCKGKVSLQNPSVHGVHKRIPKDDVGKSAEIQIA